MLNMHLLFLLGVLLCVHHYSRTYAFKDYYWRDYIFGDTPDDALLLIPDILIGQVTLLGNNLVASIYPEQRKVYTSFFGRRGVSQNIRILCSKRPGHFYWEFVKLDDLNTENLADAVKGGFNSFTKTNLFIGKANNNGTWIASSIFNSIVLGGLWVWDNNEDSLLVDEFFILKYNSSYNDVQYNEMKGCSTTTAAPIDSSWWSWWSWLKHKKQT